MKKETSFIEFVALMALLSAMTALAIDAVLPAMGVMATALDMNDPNNSQLIISFLFAGMAFGQVIYGPLSDSFGRKKLIYVGLIIYIMGCFFSMYSENFELMLLGRFLQGLGAASPRIVSVALIRDRFEGREMAQVMSFVMGVFILVPALAPAIGQGVMSLFGWRAIFAVFLAVALVALIWFALRQRETLVHPVPFSWHHIVHAIQKTLSNTTAFGYTIIIGLVFGAFVGYLELAQPIFQQIYAKGESFVLYFGVFALSIGMASFVNGRLVMRFGMRRLSVLALAVTAIVSALYYMLALYYGGVPPFGTFMAYGLIILFCQGLLFGNLNAMAMEPLGSIAGIGAAVVGSISTFIAVGSGMIVGQFYNGTLLSLVGGFALLSAASLVLLAWMRHQTMRHV